MTTDQGVRKRLRAAIHHQHMAMHEHPLMAPLLQQELTMRQLEATAVVSCLAMGVVETERAKHGAWSELSLHGHLEALKDDLPDLHHVPNHAALPQLQTVHSLLGALYVMHGSAFGAATLKKSVLRALPNAPTSFFLNCEVETWRCLCNALEALSAPEAAQAEEGAVQTIAFYRGLSDVIYANHRFHASLQAVPGLLSREGSAVQA
ncbi:heme oxygenase-like domain-containing protein [Roseobacter weihaiensis]|uniref:hypothetical protein n=1 Tax=Roseobacter weihaiensis TaxID=2763262 RepID=UPI001D0ACC2A|nr:hypothetical protein [Roseobacter sp. H9]